MRQDILDNLSHITEEEQYILISENADQHKMYARSGRFIIERRHISNLLFGESTASVSLRQHPRFCAFPPHSHDFIEIMYVCNGSITHVLGDDKIRLEADDLIIIGKNTIHSILASDKDDIGINIIISTDLFENLLKSIRQYSHLPTNSFESLLRNGGLPFLIFKAFDNISVLNLLESMINSVIKEKDTNGYILQQSLGLLISYLAKIESNKHPEETNNSDDALKKKIVNYVHTSYSTATLTEAANMVGLCAPYLSRLIRDKFGISFKELLMNERFLIACELISTTDTPIRAVIEHVGYENSSYFHKEFKKRYGMTPKNYRKNFLEK